MDNKKPINRNVILTGLTSFFTDISSEMTYPLLQGYISAIMRTKAAFLGPVLGIIEGISESTASLLKVFSGYYSDKMQNRKAPTIAGYGLSALSKILYFFPFWPSVLAARFSDRVGKGIRTAPRDAIITESTPPEAQGRAFGFQRGMDFAGAFLGTLTCFLIIKFLLPGANLMESPRAFLPIFIISLVPAVLGVIFLFFIREERVNTAAKKEKPKPNLDFRKYDKSLQMFFIVQFIFTLGNSSNQFLLLRSTKLGYTLSAVLIMYIIFNLSSTVFSPFFGSLSDKIGRKKLLMAGYSLYALIYISFGFIGESTRVLLFLFWPVYGLYYAMTEGVEKAYVADLSPKESKATALGFYNTIVGIGLLPASVIAGFLFSYSPRMPFIFGGVMGVAAVVMLAFVPSAPGKKAA